MPAPKSSSLNHHLLRISTDIMRALAHPLRLRIIELLSRLKAANVQTIYQELGVEQSVASQQLRILRQAGLVITQRQGKFVYYLLQEERLKKAGLVATQLAELVQKGALPLK